MSELPFSPMFKDEFVRLMHALANKAAIVDSLIAVIQTKRLPKAQQAQIDEAYAALQDLLDVVRALQKLVGQR